MNMRHIGRNGLLTSAGLAAAGLSTVVITSSASRAFPGRPFATFSVWWTLSLSVGLCFAVLETYLPKILGDSLLSGEDGRIVQATMARRVTVVIGLIAAAALLVYPWATKRWFPDDPGLLALAVAYVVALALQSFQRGVAVARGQFSAYAVQLVTDGAGRITATLLLLLLHAATPVTMAAGIVASAFFSLVAGTALCRSWWSWRGEVVRLTWFPLAALFAAALGPSIMNNATVPWLSSQPGLDPYVIGAFAGALGLSRIPIMFVGAVYAPVIRPLADATAEGDHHSFRRTYRLTIIFGAGLAVLFALSGWFLGPWAVSVYLGPQYEVTRQVTAILALTGGVGLMGAGSQAAVVAQARWGANPRASVIGLVGFGLSLTLLPWSATLVAAIAGLMGIGLIVAVMMSHVAGASLLPDRPVRSS